MTKARPLLGGALGAAFALSLIQTSRAAVPVQPGSRQDDDETARWSVPDGIVVDERGGAEVQRRFKDRKDWTSLTLWVETSFDSDGDGRLDRVYVDVTYPTAATEAGMKLPAIYETSPYYWGVSGADSSFFWDPNHELGDEPPERPHPPEVERHAKRPINNGSYIRQFVPRGFAVVHSASPGTGYSQGCPTVGGANESLAPKAVIDWLCGRAKGFTEPVDGDPVLADFCSGKVGMIGTSYNGTLPIAAACTGVEGLETIVPVAPNTSYYHYYRSNGLVRHPGGYMGEDIDVLYDFIHSGEPSRRSWCNETVRDGEMLPNIDRITGDFSDWWAGRDYVLQLDKVRASVLMAHGFNDWNVMPEHSFRARQRLKELGVDTICYYHQGAHGGDPPMDILVPWLTRYLHGVENGIEDGPKAYIVREEDRRSEPTAYPEFPNPAAAPVTLWPSGQGNAVGVLSGGKMRSVQTLIDDVSKPGAELAATMSSKHRLLYATPVLNAPIHLSGEARVRLRVAADRPAVNLSVWLVSLPWTDRATILENVITRGWADPQNAESIRESRPLVPGEFVDLEFALQPDDQIIPVGARIGLMVFSSDADFTLKPKPGAELSLDLGDSTLTLPVVGGGAAWNAAFEL